MLVAGCGQQVKPFTAEATAKCLSDKGFTTSTRDEDVGFVASAAPQGGLRAQTNGNTLVIAFGDTQRDVPGLERGFRRFAPKRIKSLEGIMQAKRNAVLLWTVSPTQEQLDTALGCLES